MVGVTCNSARSGAQLPLLSRLTRLARPSARAGRTRPSPKRYHVDLEVADVTRAVDRCLELGATKPDFQPGGKSWTVLTDPGGHPFCLCQAQG